MGVPLVVKGPVVKANQRIEAPTEILDLVATFLDYGKADAHADPEMDSRSLRPVLEGEADRVREVAISGLGNWRVAMKDDWKLVLGYHPDGLNTSDANP